MRLPIVVATSFVLLAGSSAAALPLTHDRPAPAAAATRGVVLVRALVAPDGTVLEAEIVRSSGDPAVDAAALERVREPGFAAARVGGRPVQVWVTMPVSYAP